MQSESQAKGLVRDPREGRLSKGDEEGVSPEEPFDPLNCQINCWACTTRVQVPVVNGVLAPEFKCGWCGAITSQNRKRKKKAKGCCSEVCGFAERLFLTSFCQKLNSGLSWFVVVIVLGLITSIIVLGVWFVVPRLPWASLHLVLAAIFSINTYFNYFLTVSQSPGSPQEIPGFQSLKLMSSHAHSAKDAEVDNQLGQQAARQQVARGAFENYTYCVYCEDIKPPQAHHCRVCDRCVLDMDHHCPFVNNCVGASNLRSFMLFLFWASTSCIYSLCMSVWVLSKFRVTMTRKMFRHAGDSFLGSFMIWANPMLELLGEGIFDRSQRWILAAFYVACVSTGVAIGVGVLFYMQMQQVLAGVSYIDSIKGDAKPNTKSRWHNLQNVFGNGHPLTWLLPRTSRPRGALSLMDIVHPGRAESDLKAE